MSVVEEFIQYSFNIEQGFEAGYSHHFINNCWVLVPLIPTYYGYGVLWTIIAIAFSSKLYCGVLPIDRFPLQKTMILLPSFKAAGTLLEGALLSYCPWYSVSTNGMQYVQMARISVTTVSYTLIITWLVLVCKGW